MKGATVAIVGVVGPSANSIKKFISSVSRTSLPVGRTTWLQPGVLRFDDPAGGIIYLGVHAQTLGSRRNDTTSADSTQETRTADSAVNQALLLLFLNSSVVVVIEQARATCTALLLRLRSLQHAKSSLVSALAAPPPTGVDPTAWAALPALAQQAPPLLLLACQGWPAVREMREAGVLPQLEAGMDRQLRLLLKASSGVLLHPASHALLRLHPTRLVVVEAPWEAASLDTYHMLLAVLAPGGAATEAEGGGRGLPAGLVKRFGGQWGPLVETIQAHCQGPDGAALPGWQQSWRLLASCLASAGREVGAWAHSEAAAFDDPLGPFSADGSSDDDSDTATSSGSLSDDASPGGEPGRGPSVFEEEQHGGASRRRGGPYKHRLKGAAAAAAAAKQWGPLHRVAAVLEAAAGGAAERLSEEKCRRAVEVAWGVYTQELPPRYPERVHAEALRAAQGSYQAVACGPCKARYGEEVARLCTKEWQRGRQQCGATSLTGRACTLAPHAVAPEGSAHSNPTRWPVASPCGRSPAPLPDPFTFSDANSHATPRPPGSPSPAPGGPHPESSASGPSALEGAAETVAAPGATTTARTASEAAAAEASSSVPAAAAAAASTPPGEPSAAGPVEKGAGGGDAREGSPGPLEPHHIGEGGARKASAVAGEASTSASAEGVSQPLMVVASLLLPRRGSPAGASGGKEDKAREAAREAAGGAQDVLQVLEQVEVGPWAALTLLGPPSKVLQGYSLDPSQQHNLPPASAALHPLRLPLATPAPIPTPAAPPSGPAAAPLQGGTPQSQPQPQPQRQPQQEPTLFASSQFPTLAEAMGKQPPARKKAAAAAPPAAQQQQQQQQAAQQEESRKKQQQQQQQQEDAQKEAAAALAAAQRALLLRVWPGRRPGGAEQGDGGGDGEVEGEGEGDGPELLEEGVLQGGARGGDKGRVLTIPRRLLKEYRSKKGGAGGRGRGSASGSSKEAAAEEVVVLLGFEYESLGGQRLLATPSQMGLPGPRSAAAAVASTDARPPTSLQLSPGSALLSHDIPLFLEPPSAATSPATTPPSTPSTDPPRPTPPPGPTPQPPTLLQLRRIFLHSPSCPSTFSSCPTITFTPPLPPLQAPDPPSAPTPPPTQPPRSAGQPSQPAPSGPAPASSAPPPVPAASMGVMAVQFRLKAAVVLPADTVVVITLPRCYGAPQRWLDGGAAGEAGVGQGGEAVDHQQVAQASRGERAGVEGGHRVEGGGRGDGGGVTGVGRGSARRYGVRLPADGALEGKGKEGVEEAVGGAEAGVRGVSGEGAREGGGVSEGAVDVHAGVGVEPCGEEELEALMPWVGGGRQWGAAMAAGSALYPT